MSKEGQRGSGKQKYPRGWRPLSRFNEACSCRRWRVIWQSADLFHSRADTSRERHSRKLARPPPPPPPPIPKLRESPLESNTNRTRATIAKLAAFLQQKHVSSLSGGTTTIQWLSRRELCIAAANDIPLSLQSFVLFLVSSLVYRRSVYTAERAFRNSWLTSNKF